MSISTRLLSAEPEYAAVHAKLVAKFARQLAAVPSGECYEMVRGELFIAHNPHDVPTETARGQRLEAHSTIVDSGRRPIAMFGPNGGCTMSGIGPRHAELLTLIDT